jgi:hypothetical protein
MLLRCAESARIANEGVEVDEMSNNWAETRAILAQLVERLQPEDALAIVRKLVEEPQEANLAARLSDFLRGAVAQSDESGQSASQDAYEAMKEQAPDISDKVD